MTHAMQPELYHVGQWKAGQAPIIDSCLVVVTHDLTLAKRFPRRCELENGRCSAL